MTLPRPLCLIAPVLAVLATAPSHAASFDCAKASSKIEKTICGDSKLSKLDEDLAKAYMTSLEGLTPEARKTMQGNQRAWLGFMQKMCADETQGNPFDGALNVNELDKSRGYCVTQAYADRIEGLIVSMTVAGIRFYKKEVFETMRDSDEKRYVQLGTHEVAYPLMNGDSVEAKAFNKLVAADAAEAGGANDTNDTAYKMVVERVTPERISMATSTSFYGHGAAHPIGGRRNLHYLREEKRLMVAEDIFRGKEWPDALTNLTQTALTTKLERVPEGDTTGGNDVDRWQLRKEGLEVVFQPYEVASYVEGMPTVVIPWSELKPYLAPGAMAIIGN